jgi:hypothetical protein
MTPGHSRGCISVILDSGEAIVGDIIAAPPKPESLGLPILLIRAVPMKSFSAAWSKSFNRLPSYIPATAAPLSTMLSQRLWKTRKNPYNNGSLFDQTIHGKLYYNFILGLSSQRKGQGG